MKQKGYVYLMGAGPGDPGLLTLRAQEILQQAEVVIYDRLVGDEILSQIHPQAEKIYVGKASRNHALQQEEINALLVEKAAQGKQVVRLKGGDPFVFGRGGEEALYLQQHGYAFEIVPGISSAVAVPAYAGIPVTHRGASSSFAVITGHEKPGKPQSSIRWDQLATAVDTLVFLMGVENLPFIVEQLINAGLDADTPTALIAAGTTNRQQVVSGCLSNIVDRVREEELHPPAVIVVGNTVPLREQLQWFENRPLWGKRIIVTRARQQASVLLNRIKELGGQPIELPSIRIKPEENLEALYQAFVHLDSYQWIMFTSVNAVELFFAELRRKGKDVRSLHQAKLCAIGPATCQRLEERGFIVDVVPEEYRAEGLIKAMQGHLKAGERVLLPRARGARQVLPMALREMGAELDEVVLYEAVLETRLPSGLLEEVLQGQADYITFTSSSTVKNFVALLGKEHIPQFDQDVSVACIGPITAETARQYGFTVDIIAQEYTISGLIEAILEHEKEKNKIGEENK
ncbi:MAG TPA: uroporphyrinogen-III C-methyltransferase [Syntrophomonadaceae bacterium]|nr:uroporphyrinogen-III C-methyltransferase [Syntrophomonadaceae bacterium]